LVEWIESLLVVLSVEQSVVKLVFWLVEELVALSVVQLVDKSVG
jgi:hypothetical protein